MDRSGELLDTKYRLLRRLGEGGMGVVYEADHVQLGRRCAVKFVHPEIARNPEVSQRFLREARAAAGIGHPGIVQIHDVAVTSDGTHYLVMEFLEGESLAARLAREHRLPPATAVEIVGQTLGALSAAHREKIVHRDLKPDNLFLAGPPANPTVKILDFGICKMDVGDGATRMTQSGAVLGTPFYMAPEQANAQPDIDHRLDLYAMGVILYECVTGRVPFTGENFTQIVMRILTERPVPPRTLDPALPPALETVILTAMAREREARFPTAGRMLQALAPFLGARSRVRSELEEEVPPSVPPGAAAAVPAPAPVPTPPVAHPPVPPTMKASAWQAATAPPAAAVPPTMPSAAMPRRAWLFWTVAGLGLVAALAGLALALFRDRQPPPEESGIAGANRIVRTAPAREPSLAPVPPNQPSTPALDAQTAQTGATGADTSAAATSPDAGELRLAADDRPPEVQFAATDPLGAASGDAANGEENGTADAADRPADIVRDRATTAARRDAGRPVEPPPPPPPGELPDVLSRADIRHGAESVQSAVRACGGGQAGTIQVEFTVGSDGAVRAARATGTFAGTDAGECAARAARRAMFPRFRRPEMTFAYPYVLSGH
jgi:serine/threonine protein kinase